MWLCVTTYKHNKCVYACACVCVCVLCNKISSIMCMYQRNVATKTHFCAHFNVTGESEKISLYLSLYPYAFVSLRLCILAAEDIKQAAFRLPGDTTCAATSGKHGAKESGSTGRFAAVF